MGLAGFNRMRREQAKKKVEKSIDDYTKKEIMALLEEKGIEFDMMRKKAELFDLIKEAI